MANIFLASRQLAAVAKMFSAAGLNLDEFLAAHDESALQAHLASLRPERDEAAIEAALLVSAGFELTAGEKPRDVLAAFVDRAAATLARANALTAALASAGVKPAADATPEQITKAIEDRISLKAAELSAQVGTLPVGTPITNDPARVAATAAAPLDPALKGRDRYTADFNRQFAARSAGRN